MPLRKTLATLLLALAITSLPATSAIYKSLDADGNTVFSDAPLDKDDEEIALPPINTLPAFTPPANTQAPVNKTPPSEPLYTLAFSYPQHDQAIRNNAGNLTITLSLAPAIDGKNTLLVVTLDGREIARGVNTHIPLNNIPRGTHTLAAHIENADGHKLAEADSVQFHLLRVNNAGSP